MDMLPKPQQRRLKLEGSDPKEREGLVQEHLTKVFFTRLAEFPDVPLEAMKAMR